VPRVLISQIQPCPMTDGGVHTGYYFIERLGSRQTEPLYLDFSYHLESLHAQLP
jgi:hypothetical protein